MAAEMAEDMTSPRFLIQGLYLGYQKWLRESAGQGSGMAACMDLEIGCTRGMQAVQILAHLGD